jgi:UDP-N-acetylmuramate dehydrogenase
MDTNESGFPEGIYRYAVVKEDEPLSAHTSLKVGGAADCYVIPRDEPALIDTIRTLREAGVPYYVLGGGTNVVVRDGGFRGAVIGTGRGLGAVGVDAERGIVSAGAGAALSVVAKKAAAAGLSGLEPISGIPGTVGGALYMNAGSYGGEMLQVVIQARVYDAEEDRVKVMSLYELRLGYRTSVFQTRPASSADPKRASDPYAILSVTFALKRKDPGKIKAAMRKYARARGEKQPMDAASAGSFFKRPEGAYAGALIEQAGLKGLSVGGAQVSEKHAGFIVNTGGAKAADVLALAAKVRAAVLADSGYTLETEPQIIGEDT